MDRVAAIPLTSSGVDEDRFGRALVPPDRHDRCGVSWNSWSVGRLTEPPDPSTRHDARPPDARSMVAHTLPEVGQRPSVDRSLVGSDVDGLAEVPWLVWAVDHPCEAERAEAWLRTSGPSQSARAIGSVRGSVGATSAGGGRAGIEPWMVWALDHPCEAQRAEAWLDGFPDRDACSIEAPTSTVDRRAGADVAVEERVPLWRRATSAVATTVLVLAIVVVVFLGYGRLNNRWYQLVAVEGGSMEPTYSIGDVLVLTRPPGQIEVGMVLTMQVEGSVVTHRVVEVLDDGSFVTQGDANDFPDDFGGLDVRVVGQVRGDLPWIGTYLGRRGSTNAWFTDRASASASASSAIGFAPERAGVEVAAASPQAASTAVDGVEEASATDGTVNDGTVTGESVTGDIVTENPTSEGSVVSDSTGGESVTNDVTTVPPGAGAATDIAPSDVSTVSGG